MTSHVVEDVGPSQQGMGRIGRCLVLCVHSGSREMVYQAHFLLCTLGTVAHGVAPPTGVLGNSRASQAHVEMDGTGLAGR